MTLGRVVCCSLPVHCGGRGGEGEGGGRRGDINKSACLIMTHQQDRVSS